MKRGAENGRPEASFSLPSLPPSLLQSLQVPHSSSFSRSLERAESIDYSAAAASLSTSALCSRLLSAEKDEPNLSLSLCLSGCMYWLRCLAHLLSRSLALPLSFRHSFHKFIAQQIACEVSDAQEQKEATDPQREWTLSLSDRASGRQTTRQIDLKYCITHAPQSPPDIQFHEDCAMRCASSQTCTL